MSHWIKTRETFYQLQQETVKMGHYLDLLEFYLTLLERIRVLRETRKKLEPGSLDR